MSVRRLLRPWIAIALSALATDPLRAQSKQERKVEAARRVYEAVLFHPRERIPEVVLRQTRCLAVFPDVVEAAFGLGGSRGTGVVSCRDEAGEWSPPSFLKLSEGSLGLQLGYKSTDLILFFVTDRGARSLLQDRFSLGGDVSVAAGSVDRAAGVTTDAEATSDLYIYADAKGVFAGVSLEGLQLATSFKAIRRFYGQSLWPEEILFERSVSRVPSAGQAFMDGLRELPRD